jgi:hypothetical protein
MRARWCESRREKGKGKAMSTNITTVSPSTASALASSRKVWVGIVTLCAIAGAITLRIFDKIPSDAIVPTIYAISGVGLTLIGGIAYEDAAEKGAPNVTNNVTTLTPPPPADSKAEIAPVSIDTSVA